MTYFLYARKSTDDKDKQIHSTEDQIAVLRPLAKQEGLETTAVFEEKQSAKVPGRSIFNEMLARIEKGEAQGILCWKLDRLARNPVDGLRIIWMLQEGVIQHIRTYERSYYPTDNVLPMYLEFGMANQYSRDLGSNTLRGLREKAKRGDYPGPAPVGYLNNPRTKTVMVDKRKAPIVLRAFELYAENNSRYEDIAQLFYENGIRTGGREGSSGGRRWSKDRVKRILTNPFYYGDFEYAGDVYHGRHTPIVPKRLWDRVQEIVELRGHKQKAHADPQALCRLLRCGMCGCFITAEVIVKRQKNGNVHRYVYYRCTRKRGPCAEPYVREEELASQLSNLLAGFALPQNWANKLALLTDEDERKAEVAAAASVHALREKMADLDMRIRRLTDLYVEQDIERDAYLERKRGIMSERKSAEEQTARLERNAAGWLQPLREWIQEASILEKTAESTDLTLKKSSLRKIFGSNLLLKNRSVVSVPTPPYASLREARQNFG